MTSDARTDRSRTRRINIMRTICKILDESQGTKWHFNDLSEKAHERIGVGTANFNECLSELERLGIIVKEGTGRDTIYYSNHYARRQAFMDMLNSETEAKYRELEEIAEEFSGVDLEQSIELIKNRLLISILPHYFLVLGLYDEKHPKHRDMMRYSETEVQNAVKEDFNHVVRTYTNPDLSAEEIKEYKYKVMSNIAKLYLNELNDAIKKLEAFISDKKSK